MSDIRPDKQVYPFGIIPAEVFMDERLTLETMRVLGALYTFRDKHTSLAFPSRDELSSRCAAMHPSNISAASAKLVELGWLVKEGKGGNSKATRYTIKVPEVVAEMAVAHRAICKARRDKRVAEQATVAQSATVADDTTRTCSDTGYTLRVADDTTRIEQTKGTDQLRTELIAPDKPGAAQKRLSAPTDEIWHAYNSAYFNRYGTEAVRNGKANAQLLQLINRLGRDEALHVAVFYVAQNNKYYIQKSHTLDPLVKDAEGLRTQWATGRTMTASKATQIDRTANNLDTVNQAIEMMRARKQNATV